MSALAESPPPGLVPPSSADGRSGFLADVIVELGLADREDVDRATAESRLKGATLATVLVEEGILDERALARAVAERHGLAMLDLEAFPVDPEAGALVGRTTARRYGVLPAGFAPDGSLMLAMADPGDSLARNDVAVMTKLEVTPVIAPRAQIEAAVEALPETGVVGSASSERAEQDAAPAAGAMLWQAEEPAVDDAERSRDASAVQPAGAGPEHAAQDQRRSSELGEQRGRHGELELELSGVRSELEELRTRLGELERRLADRDAVLRELEAELAASRGGAA